MLDNESGFKVRLRLLGTAEQRLFDPRAGAIRLTSAKGLGLLAYLAMTGGGPVSRSALANLLWSDRLDRQARQNLRQCLATLRRDLGAVADTILIVDDRSVALRVQAIDVDARALTACAESPDNDERWRCTDIPWGPFLEGFDAGAEPFAEWVTAERTRLAAIAARTFCDLAALAEAQGNGERAVLAAERLVAVDPAEEEFHRRLLSLEARYRGSDIALARAKWLAAMLEQELDSKPDAATLALVEDIRRQRRPKPHDVSVPAPAPTCAEAPSSGILCRPDSPSGTLAHGGLNRRRLVAVPAALALAFAIGAAATALWKSSGVPVAVDRSEPSWNSPHVASRSNDSLPPREVSGVVAIVVMPFTASDGPGEESLLAANVISDDLINSLSRVRSLRVIARSTARAFREAADAAEIGKALGVRYVLEGSVTTRGDVLRVNATLSDVRSGHRIWSSRYERPVANRYRMKDEIVANIARELSVEVVRAESDGAASDPGAHELIFKGWAAMARAATAGVDALRDAEGHFVRALNREPENPRALSGLGAFHVNMAVQLFAADPAPHLAQGEALLRRAMEKHPDVDGLHVAMGLLSLAKGRAHDAAAWFERAVQVNPSDASAYAQYGRVLAGQERAQEGLEHITYAMKLSPRDPHLAYWLGFAGAAELELKRFDTAIVRLRNALAINPRQPRTALTLAAAYALAGREVEAREKLREVQKTLPHLSTDMLIARFFGSGGKRSARVLDDGLRRALVWAADPWESPRLPSETADQSKPGRPLIPMLVLPFKTYNDGPSGTAQIFAEMMTDDLINQLSRVPSVRVISRQTASSFRGQTVDVGVIGREFNVRYVLEGALSVRGEKTRLNVELIDPKTRLPVWSGRIEREGFGSAQVRDEIVARLARELHFDLFPIESSRLAAYSDAEMLAFRGWAAMWRSFAKTSPDAFGEARSYFTQAQERDPDLLTAQIGLGAYHVNVGAQRLDDDSAAHLDRAWSLLQDALQKAPDDPGVHIYLGLVQQARGDLPGAVDTFERALQLNPSNATARAHIGHALARMGRHVEGLEHITYAMRLSPRDPNLAYWLEFAGGAELELNNYAQAIESYRRATVLNPDYPRGWAGLAAANALSGNLQAAQSDAEKLKALARNATAQALVRRFGRPDGQAPRLREGLRLALIEELSGAKHPP